MSAEIATGWAKWSSALRSRRTSFYLLLLAVAVWHLGGDTLTLGRFFRSENPNAEGVCQFDSFSPPSIAGAILKQESDRLLAEYIGRGKPVAQLDFRETQNPGYSNLVELELDPLSPAALEHPWASDWATIRPIQQLDAEVQELGNDLNRKLLLVYFESHLWSEFVDRYLHVLDKEPQSTTVVMWGQCALACSQSCGRTEEVLDALSHLVRFHQELKTVRGVRNLLGDWSVTHPGGGTVSRR